MPIRQSPLYRRSLDTERHKGLLEGHNVSIQIHDPIRPGAPPRRGSSAAVVVVVILLMTTLMSADQIAAAAALVTAGATVVTRLYRVDSCTCQP